MDTKAKDYTFPKESHSGSVFHLTREHLELLVIWSHCHGNQCTFAPTWREITEEHQTGLLTVLWECEAGHSYHWWTGGVCRSECDQDQTPAKHKPSDDSAQARKPQRMKLDDGDIMEEIDSLDGCCKPFLTADGKPIRNGASARHLSRSRSPSPSQLPWRDPGYGDDRGKSGTDGVKKPDVLYIKTEKEETSGYSDPTEVKVEGRSQSRGPRKYHPGEKPLGAGQGQAAAAESPDGCRKRPSSAADSSGFAAHCSNGKVHVGEVHHSPYPVPRQPGGTAHSTTKSPGISGATKPANHSQSSASTELLLDSGYGRNSDMSNAELDCETSIPCTQEGVLEFLHTVLKTEVVDEIYSSVRLANESDVEVLTENLSGKEALLLDSSIQTNARLYFSTGGWAALSATLEVLGDSTSELMVINPYTLNAEIMDEEQIIVAHVPALLPSADDKKRKIKYPVTKGEIRRRIIPPENMSKTVIKSYLRLRRDNRFDIRQLLDLPVTGYDRTLHTSFTRLCEGEAKTLTENFHQLNLGYFPVDECANRIAEQSEASEIFTARKVVEDLDSILDSFMWQEHPYNLITHGFGPQNIRVVLDLVKLLLRESLRKSAS
eukprot:gi/632970856/ref/XP_007901879.1/ PREDICTED: uncharacterized protein LOC103185275 isoform X2 [Callorhinchus milii]